MPDRGVVIRDKRQPGWFHIDDELLDDHAKTIKANGIAVYCALARHAGNKSQECWPSIRTIAKEAGMSVRTVQRTLAKLKEAGLILIEQTQTDSGDYDHNVYTLLNIKRGKGEQEPPRPKTVLGGDKLTPPTADVVTERQAGGVTEAHELDSFNYTWGKVLEDLQMQMVRSVFNTLFLGTRATQNDGTVTVYVRDAGIAGLLTARWTKTVARTLAGVLGDWQGSVEFVTETEEAT
jgi:DNA-binding Lrp family transcriptional regulator